MFDKTTEKKANAVLRREINKAYTKHVLECIGSPNEPIAPKEFEKKFIEDLQKKDGGD